MMDSLLFGLVMLAIPWLVAWTMVDRSKPNEVWWPFDIRQVKTPAASQPAEGSEALHQPRRTRTPPKRPWKRSSF